MTVRVARHMDLPGVVAVMRRAYERSIYAGVTTFDEDGFKRFYLQAMHRHGQTNVGGCLVLVSDREGAIAGFMIGVLDNIYPCLEELYATDVLFIMDERAPPRDAPKMIGALTGWGRKNPKVLETICGVNGAIGDFERAGKLYERAGFSRHGAMYRMRFDRTAMEVRNVGSG